MFYESHQCHEHDAIEERFKSIKRENKILLDEVRYIKKVLYVILVAIIGSNIL